MSYTVTKLLLPLEPGPGGKQNRPGTKISPRHIVVHRTGNPDSSARANRNWFARGEVWGSAHYNVDKDEVVLCIPEDERAYHVAVQNRSTDGLYVDVARWSIGIEFCEPFTQEAYEKFVWLCADICLRYGLNPAVDITPHCYWDPRDRPYDPISVSHYGGGKFDGATMVDLGPKMGPMDVFNWKEFVEDVTNELSSMKTPKNPPPREPDEPKPLFSDISGHWAREIIEEMARAGVVRGLPDGRFNPDAPISRAEAVVLHKRAIDYALAKLGQK